LEPNSTPKDPVDARIQLLNENRALADKWIAALKDNKPTDLDALIPEEGFAYEAMNAAMPAGLKGWGTFIKALHQAFPGLEIEIDEIYVNQDGMVTRWTAKGTHGGQLAGYVFNTGVVLDPTNKEVSLTGTSIDRVKDGRIISHKDEVDRLGLLQQLGATPTPSTVRDEDKRLAAGIHANLGSLMVTSAIALATVEAAVLVFVLDKRNPDLIFLTIAVVVFVCYLVSAVFGVWVIDLTTQALERGERHAGTARLSGWAKWRAKWRGFTQIGFGAGGLVLWS
jgi:predicted ester cyclase